MRIASLSPLALGVAVSTLAAEAPARAPSTPARLLAGRVAGEPVQCISQTRIIDTQTFDDGSIFYRMGGGPDYLQRPRDCPQLNSNRAYVTSTPSTQLCAGDSLRVFDAGSRIPYGACVFDAFVPYPRPRRQ